MSAGFSPDGLLTRSQQERIGEWNSTSRPFPRAACIPGLVRARQTAAQKDLPHPGRGPRLAPGGPGRASPAAAERAGQDASLRGIGGVAQGRALRGRSHPLGRSVQAFGGKEL